MLKSEAVWWQEHRTVSGDVDSGPGLTLDRKNDLGQASTFHYSL